MRVYIASISRCPFTELTPSPSVKLLIGHPCRRSTSLSLLMEQHPTRTMCSQRLLVLLLCLHPERHHFRHSSQRWSAPHRLLPELAWLASKCAWHSTAPLPGLAPEEIPADDVADARIAGEDDYFIVLDRVDDTCLDSYTAGVICIWC